MMDADGSNQQSLTDASAWSVQPKWFPIISTSTAVYRMSHANIATWAGLKTRFPERQQ
jgi:Tol biopolymer transport system component